MDNRIEIVRKLVKDEAFLKEFLAKEKIEDVQKLFAENGVELTLDDLRTIGDILNKAASGELTKESLGIEGELTEDELAKVAGGLSEEVPVPAAVGLTIAAEILWGGVIGTVLSAFLWAS